MKHDKKLDNVLPRSNNRRPASYLELYRRRFGVERRLASPEGSGLSICGDSSDERRRGLLEAADEAASSSLRCSSLPRDDRSELSLYRRLLRSPCRHTDDDEMEVKESASFSFRPYTLQDYRNFRAASARLDRSLGPDRAAISARREGLARRRSYGDAVSAWNLQRITSCVKKSQTGSTRLTGSKSSQSFGATGLVAPEEITKDVSKRPVKASCRNQREKTPSVGLARKSKSVPPRKPRAATVVSAGKLEPNLQTLRARHFDEKQMIDQLVRRTMLV